MEYHYYNLDNKKILCLQIVRDITKFPYILMKDITDKNGKDKTVRAGVIYTRNNDRNIPINRTASYTDPNL